LVDGRLFLIRKRFTVGYQTLDKQEALKEAIRQEVAAITAEIVLKVMDNYREATSVYQYSRPPLE